MVSGCVGRITPNQTQHTGQPSLTLSNISERDRNFACLVAATSCLTRDSVSKWVEGILEVGSFNELDMEEKLLKRATEGGCKDLVPVGTKLEQDESLEVRPCEAMPKSSIPEKSKLA